MLAKFAQASKSQNKPDLNTCWPKLHKHLRAKTRCEAICQTIMLLRLKDCCAHITLIVLELNAIGPSTESLESCSCNVSISSVLVTNYAQGLSAEWFCGHTSPLNFSDIHLPYSPRAKSDTDAGCNWERRFSTYSELAYYYALSEFNTIVFLANTFC
jgi:hypothetical protein